MEKEIEEYESSLDSDIKNFTKFTNIKHIKKLLNFEKEGDFYMLYIFNAYKGAWINNCVGEG